MGPIHPGFGTRLCTFRPAGYLAAYPALRDEGERPSGHPEAMAAAVLVPSVASRAPASLLAIYFDLPDLKIPRFALDFPG